MAKQRLLYVVGARPNFVKMAPVVAELGSEGSLTPTTSSFPRVSTTPQRVSELFIDQLEFPSPHTGSRSGRARTPSRRHGAIRAGRGG
jgi:hypothetical protein